MDPQITAALIGAAGPTVAAIINYRRARSRDKRVGDLERGCGSTSEGIKEELLKRYGFKTRYVVSKNDIMNLEGTVKVTRSIRGVQIIRQGVVLADIPGMIWVDHPEGKIDEFPDQKWKRPHFPKAVTLKVERREQKRCEFTINVTGGLTQDDPPLDYEYQAVYLNGVCSTKEEMDEAYKDSKFRMEYHSYDVDGPVDMLELEVVFPEGYTAEAYPAVFCGKTEDIHNHELQRVQSGFRMEPSGAHFRIQDPLLGFRYAIYWVPPSHKRLESLRQKS